MANLSNVNSQYVTARVDDHSQLKIVSDLQKLDTDGGIKSLGAMMNFKVTYDDTTDQRSLQAQVAGNKSLYINDTVTTLNTVSTEQKVSSLKLQDDVLSHNYDGVELFHVSKAGAQSHKQLNMSSQPIINVSLPTNPFDAANKKYVDDRINTANDRDFLCIQLGSNIDSATSQSDIDITYQVLEQSVGSMISYVANNGHVVLQPATYLVMHKTDLSIVSNMDEPVFGMWSYPQNTLSQHSQDIIDAIGSKLGSISGEGSFSIEVVGQQPMEYKFKLTNARDVVQVKSSSRVFIQRLSEPVLQ